MIESSATGFKPNSPVKACILPSVYIGGFMTDASGAYSGVLPVPAGVSTGQQTLQANGFTSSGALRSLSLGILVRPAAPVTMRTAEAEVLFDTLSAQITPQGRAILISLVRKTRTQGMSTVVIGYVQPGGLEHERLRSIDSAGQERRALPPQQGTRRRLRGPRPRAGRPRRTWPPGDGHRRVLIGLLGAISSCGGRSLKPVRPESGG